MKGQPPVVIVPAAAGLHGFERPPTFRSTSAWDPVPARRYFDADFVGERPAPGVAQPTWPTG